MMGGYIMAVSKVIFGNQVVMDISQDTVEASKLLSGYTAHGADGEAITGSCTFDADTSDANAVASELLTGKTAYANGRKITGSMPNNGAVSGYIDDLSDPYVIPSGYHDGSGTVGVDSTEAAKIIPGNIKSGVEILGVTGTYTGEAISAQSKSATPYTTPQTILPDTGYDYLSQVTVAAISYVETDNAGGGKTAMIGAVAPVSP